MNFIFEKQMYIPITRNEKKKYITAQRKIKLQGKLFFTKKKKKKKKYILYFFIYNF